MQQPVRRLTAGELERLGKDNCIDKVEGSTTWISPIVIVLKHYDGIRMCLASVELMKD